MRIESGSERIRDPLGQAVLDREEVAAALVEGLGPQRRAVAHPQQPGVDPEARRLALQAAFDDRFGPHGARHGERVRLAAPSQDGAKGPDDQARHRAEAGDQEIGHAAFQRRVGLARRERPKGEHRQDPRRGSRPRRNRRADDLDWCDEPVPGLRHRLDAAVAEGAPQQPDSVGEVGFLDDLAGPDRGEQVIARHQRTGLRDELHQRVQRPRGQLHLLALTQQPPLANFQQKGPESVALVAGRDHRDTLDANPTWP